MIGKYFLKFCELSFHFLWSTKIFNFNEAQFILFFSSVACAFGVISKNPSPYPLTLRMTLLAIMLGKDGRQGCRVLSRSRTTVAVRGALSTLLRVLSRTLASWLRAGLWSLQSGPDPGTNTDMLSLFSCLSFMQILFPAPLLVWTWLGNSDIWKTGSGSDMDGLGWWGGAPVTLTQCETWEDTFPLSGPQFPHLYYVRGWTWVSGCPQASGSSPLQSHRVAEWGWQKRFIVGVRERV